MKYRIYLEDEYNSWGGKPEPDWEIECSNSLVLDFDLKEYCKYLYSDRDGWEWMKDSDERILAIGESGEKLYFTFELDFEPTFFVLKCKDKEKT